MSRITRTLLAVLVAAIGGLGMVALASSPAAACSYGGGAGGGGINLGGQCPPSHDPGEFDQTHPVYDPNAPKPPVYEDYYTPACSMNGPPGSGSADAMCMGAAQGCKYRQDGGQGSILMRHFRREVGEKNWTFVANECRGPGEPAVVEPAVTQQMVLDAAFAAAPHPTAHVEPGTRSFVNVPNNYWADAEPTTVTVAVLGHPIAVQFTIDDISWDFGDHATGSGPGVQDAAVGAAGAVEHAYLRQGSYPITVTTRVGAHFTLPNGQRMDLPGVLRFTSDPVTLPVGEIQTRVDSTG